jgi:hypothetical protein
VGHGAFHPFPRRFGGNKHNGKPLIEVVQESLSAARGLAFDSDNTTTVVWLENHAYARAIACDGWQVNERLSLQWDPRRTTDMLPRWESIFRLRPGPDVSDRARRAELTARWQRFSGVTNHSRIVTALEGALGDYLYAVEYISLANAVVHVPSGSYPWGTVASGAPWYSTVAHIMIRLQKPTGATEGQFYEMAGKVPQILDPIVSSFVTFAWYRAPVSTPVAVSGGPSAGGFYCDDLHNLDNNAFAS